MNLEINTKDFKKACLKQERDTLVIIPDLIKMGVISESEAEGLTKICLENIVFMEKNLDCAE